VDGYRTGPPEAQFTASAQTPGAAAVGHPAQSGWPAPGDPTAPSPPSLRDHSGHDLG